MHHAVPKILGGSFVFRIAGEFIEPRQTDQLGDLRVAVQTRQLVFTQCQRVQHGLLIELARQGQILRFCGQCIDIGEDFIHTAVFLFEHDLPLVVTQGVRRVDRPVRKLDQHVFSLSIAGIKISIAQAREQFVHRVPGNPPTMDTVAVAGGDIGEHRLAVGNG